jgi:hypothetical protein
MSFNIEILKVGVENKGKYRVAVIDHKTSEGKVDSKKVMSFVNKEVFTTLSQAQPGDVFEITSEKDKNGYWQWTSANAAGKNTGASTGAAKSPVRSTYETPEERAAKQVYIVRQSSLANAIAYYASNPNPDDKVYSEDDVVQLAKIFEDYVFNGVKDEVIPTEVS